MILNKTNNELLVELNGRVFGHAEAKKSLINLVNRSKMRHYQKFIECLHKEYLMQPSKILLLGGSGTGKTHLIDCLQDIVEFPLIKIDATKLTPTGNTDGINEKALQKMIMNKAEYLTTARPNTYFSLEGAIDQMVIFVDEIDKLGVSFESSGKWNQHVQSNFLTLIDNKDQFSGVSWVFAGAFNDLTVTPTQASMGFNNKISDSRKEITDEDIIKSGLIPELVGRINHIIPLDIFTEVEYYKILTNTLLPQKRIELSYFGIYEDNIEEHDLRQMAKDAEKSSQGVRYLIRELNKIFLQQEFEYEEFNNGLIKLEDGL